MRFWSDFEPKDINLTRLCEERFPGKQWKDLALQEQTQIISQALQSKHWLLDPHSAQMRFWDAIVVVALAFTGLFTPYEVVFMRDLNLGLFITNRVFDAVFLLDMVLQLFLKVEVKREGKYGTMVVRDPSVLRRRYLRQWFLVDLVSLMPIDLILLALDEPDASLQRMKIFRCLRLLRLVKLLRILRTSRIVVRWQNYLAIPFSQQKFAKFVTVLVLVSHWMACLWSAVGLFFGMDLCPDPAAGPVTLEEAEVPLDEVSWVTTLFTSSKRSPDSPCNSIVIYLAALHWSVMTITSIGYGDIVPVRDYEYVVSVGCMLIGGVLWAYIIGCTCSILSNMHPVEENFETNTDLLNMIMKEVAVPSEKKQQYREYLREAKVHDAMAMFNQVTKSFSPLLRKELMLHITESWIRGVYYFAEAPTSLVMELAERLQTRFFARREPLTDIRNCLVIIERGTVAHGGRILVPGGFFQEDVILTNSALQVTKPTVSLTYTLILLLSRRDLDDVLKGWPDFERKIRWYATKLAMCRVVKICAEVEAEQRKADSFYNSAGSSLSTVFDCLENCSSKALSRRRGGITTAICRLDWKSSNQASRPRSQEQLKVVESALHRTNAVKNFKLYGQDLNNKRNSVLAAPQVGASAFANFRTKAMLQGMRAGETDPLGPPITKSSSLNMFRRAASPTSEDVVPELDSGFTDEQVPCQVVTDPLDDVACDGSGCRAHARMEQRLNMLAQELRQLGQDMRAADHFHL